MDKQATNKMPKPFETDDGLNGASAASASNQQFVLREDDRLKQEEDYRQGNRFYSSHSSSAIRSFQN